MTNYRALITSSTIYCALWAVAIMLDLIAMRLSGGRRAHLGLIRVALALDILASLVVLALALLFRTWHLLSLLALSFVTILIRMQVIEELGGTK